jgi:hypothetical protein
MHSDEADPAELKPRDCAEVVIDAKDVRANVVFSCPECGASLRLTNGSTVETDMRRTRTEWPLRAGSASIYASPTGEQGPTEIAPAPDQAPNEPAALESAATTGAQLPDVVRPGDEYDEPTRVQVTADAYDSSPTNPKLEPPDDLEEADTRLFKPGDVLDYHAESDHHPLDTQQTTSAPTTVTLAPAQVIASSRAESTTPLAAPVPAPTPQFVDRNPLSDAPLTLEAPPAFRSKSRGGPLFAVGSCVLALGVGIALYQLMQPVGTKSRASAAVVPDSPVTMTAPLAKESRPSGEGLARPDTKSALPEPGPAEARTTAPIASTPDQSSNLVPQQGETPTKIGAARTTPKVGLTAKQSDSEDAAEAKPSKPATAKVQDEASERAHASKPTFDAEAATEALDDAANRAGACRQVDDPSGVAVVTVTFAPSGRVTTATIAGLPFVNTPTGSCIARQMRTAKVPKFTGGFVTVKRTVTVR